MKNLKSKVFIYIGIVCIISAIGLTAINIIQEKKAELEANKALEQIKSQIPNLSEEEMLKKRIKMNDEIGMPVIEIDGKEYVGFIGIPSLGLALPIQSSWDYPKLKSSPCRYMGSIYDNSMIIIAHNYKRHFGKLYTLEPGSEIIFNDVNGLKYSYTVLGSETIDGNNVDEMINNEYDLTLFTCTYSGKYRMTIRCRSND